MMNLSEAIRHREAPPGILEGGHQPVPLRKRKNGKRADVVSVAREAYQTLYLNVVNRLGATADEAATLGITAANPGEGASNIAVNLGVTVASNTARNVLLVDGNFYAPVLHHYLSVPENVGLSEVLRGESQFDSAIAATRYDRLWLLQAGFTTPDLADESVLNLPVVDHLLSQLKQCFDTVIFDLPSVRQGTAASLLAKKLDGTILVIRSSATKKGEVREALARLGNANIVGVAVNFVQSYLPLFLSDSIK